MIKTILTILYNENNNRKQYHQYSVAFTNNCYNIVHIV